MQKYWGKQIFSHGSFPEVGEKQMALKKKKKGKTLVNTMASFASVRHHAAWTKRDSKEWDIYYFVLVHHCEVTPF